MSLLKDREVAMCNAHHRLISTFHLLREVMWAEKISLKEKTRLFSNFIEGLMIDITIAYPDLSAEIRDSVRLVMTSSGQCSEEALQTSIENLNLILEYRRFAAEFRILADKVGEIYDRSDLADEAKCKEMKIISDAFVPITDGIGRHRDLVRGPYGGYFWGDALKTWVDKIMTASNKV